MGENINPKTERPREPVGQEYIHASIRDIFSPLIAPKKATYQPDEQGQSSPIENLKLTGTIIGGRNPIAIIDEQFIREGDWISEYKVVRIRKKDILLESDDGKIALEMMKND